MRTVRAVTGRVHDVDVRVVDRDDKRARKAGTAVVGGVGRFAFDVYVVTLIASIPLKGVLLIVLDGKVGAVLQVELVVAAEINGMNVASIGTVHSEGRVVERKGGVLACAHRHPIPLGGIRSGANARHGRVDVLKCEADAPKGDALVGELQRVAVAVDDEALAQVKTGGLGVSKELDGCVVGVLSSGERLVEGCVLLAVELGNLGGSGSLCLGGGSRLVAQGDGGDCGDGSVIAGRGIGVGIRVVGNGSGRILGIGGLRGGSGRCGSQLVGAHRGRSEGAQRCDQTGCDHGSSCARSVHLHFFSF